MAQHPGKIIWQDLFTNDIDAAGKFYTTLFGWEVERTSPTTETMTVFIKGHAVANISKLQDVKIGSQWLCSLSVANVDTALKTFESNGGSIYKSARDLPDRGRFGIGIDPQGAPIAVLTSSTGDPEDYKLEFGDWIGGELWALDVTKAVAFYQQLAPYEAESVDIHEKVKYQLLFSDDTPRAGVVSIPWENISPQWVPYVAVTDIQATVNKAKTLGGRIIIAPDMSIKSGRVAILKDPMGAVFGVQELDKE